MRKYRLVAELQIAQGPPPVAMKCVSLVWFKSLRGEVPRRCPSNEDVVAHQSSKVAHLAVVDGARKLNGFGVRKVNALVSLGMPVRP
jgi:hypothetical protein